jgi:hypothetical protein
MAKYNMKKIITLLMLTFIVSISFAQYTPMTAAGYQFKRILCDSTLHIPSFCGIPTLRNSTAKNGAIAMDTCNNKLYKWTRVAGWSDISGGGIDSLKRSSDSIFARKSGVWVFQYKDSIGGGGSQNLQQVTDAGNTTNHELIVDDGSIYSEKIGLSDFGNNIVYPLRYTNVFQGAIDIIDDLNAYPPTIFGYNNTSTNPSYKIGYDAGNGKPFIDFIGTDSKLKITDEFISFSNDGSAITKLQPIPNSNSDIHYLPQNDGVDDTLLYQAPQDGQYYAQQNGGWASFTPGGSGSQNLQQVTDIGSVTTNSITVGQTLNIKDPTTSNIGSFTTFGNGLSNPADWDLPDASGTLALSVNGQMANAQGDISLTTQNGRFGNDTATIVMAKVHNDAGIILTNGKVVAFSTSGTSSDAPSVKLANNKADSTSANTFGFVSGTIAVNDTGWVILSGKIEKLNTSAFSNGDIIYLDSISGGYTKTKPVAPYHQVYLGTVVKANAGNGSIFVKVINGLEIEELHDVKITTKTNNDILAYESSTNLWKNKTIPTVLGYTPIAPADTSVFQRKSLSANTIMANNTASTANVTAQAYYDVAEQNMTNTITFGGTAPTTLTSANYSWSQIGKTVTVQFNALYVNAGAGITGLSFTLPSDMPAPLVPTGWSAASNYLYTGAAATYSTATTVNGNVATSYIRRNAANSAYELGYAGTGVTARGFKFTLIYKAQ